MKEKMLTRLERDRAVGQLNRDNPPKSGQTGGHFTWGKSIAQMSESSMGLAPQERRRAKEPQSEVVRQFEFLTKRRRHGKESTQRTSLPSF